MSILCFERSAGGHGTWRRLTGMVGRSVSELRRQRKARRDRRHLLQLPDYLLRDIGLSRMEVDDMTWRKDRPRFGVLPSISWRHEQ